MVCNNSLYKKNKIDRCHLPIKKTQGWSFLHTTLKLFKATLRKFERLNSILATQTRLHDTAVPISTCAHFTPCQIHCEIIIKKNRCFNYQYALRKSHRDQNQDYDLLREPDCWLECGAQMGSHQRWFPQISQYRSAQHLLLSSRPLKKNFSP